MTSLKLPFEVALTYEGVREVGGANRGPEVERFLKMVGKPPGLSWCAAFVCTCTYESYEARWRAQGNTGPFNPKTLPIIMTAGAWMLWTSTPKHLRCPPKAGSIFIIDGGMSADGSMHKGHTGFVVDVLSGGWVSTVEGNTSEAGSHNGDGVYRRKRRVGTIAGFIDPNWNRA